MSPISRRGFLAASAAASAAVLLPARARAAGPALTLTAQTRVIEVRGRAASVLGLANAQGGQGLVLDPGQPFRVDLTNRLDVDTIVHWHGQIPPNVQDGVPTTSPMLKPGETRSFDYTARPGTFWMHSHIPVQEVGLLAAPLIVRRPEEAAADRQEVVMFLHDFSFLAPEEVLAKVTGGAGMDHAAMGHGTGSDPVADGSTDGSMGGSSGGMTHGMGHGMGHDMGMMMHGSGEGGGMMMGMEMGMGGAPHLNDFDFDAYLVNDRTLDDPEVVAVEPGGRVLLRVINGSAMTAYWIDLGAATGRLVATDGDLCQPLAASRFALAPAQRLEIEIDLPPGNTALPVLALREGGRERSGLILVPTGASVSRVDPMSDAAHPAVSTDLAQEAQLRALAPLTDRPLDRGLMMMLGGTHMPYRWTIDGATWGNHRPLQARSGDRVEIMFHNMSPMAHPMHLHGHAFQVVDLGRGRFSGALRDTVTVPPMGMVTIAFDAGEAAPWMFHCHHMGHLETGMMTELAISG